MAKPTPLPPAPKDLSKPARRLWAELQTDFVLTASAGQALLTQALHAWDRAEQARALVDAEGAILKDRLAKRCRILRPRLSETAGLSFSRRSKHSIWTSRPRSRPVGR
jgi:hypothetical protein